MVKYFSSHLFRLTSVLLTGGVLVTSCAKQHSIIEIILPTGFNGNVQIILDQNNGALISPRKINGNHYKYFIPQSGKLTVNDLSPFQLHESIVRFDNGALVLNDQSNYSNPNFEWKALPTTLGKKGEKSGTTLDGTVLNWELIDLSYYKERP